MGMFGVVKLSKLTGMSIQRLNKWLHDGLFEPVGFGEYKGRKVRRYNEKSVREILLLKELRKYVSYEVIRRAAKILRSYGHNPFSEGSFLVIGNFNDPEKVQLIKAKDGNFIELTGKYAGQLLLPLWNLFDESKR